MTLYLSETDVRSEKIRTLHHWWLTHCRTDAPDRADFDPFAVKRLLPNLIIADVEPDPFRIRYRLVGTKVVEATGFDFTDTYLDELIPVETDEPWMEDYRTSYAQRRPVFGHSTIAAADVRYAYEFALFPLRKGHARIEQFIALEDYFDYSFIVHQVPSWRMFLPPAAAYQSKLKSR